MATETKVTHSPLPWTAVCETRRGERSVKSRGYYVASCHGAPGDLGDHGQELYSPEANAEFIVRAVNAHDALVEALKALLPVAQRWESLTKAQDPSVHRASELLAALEAK